MAKRKRVRLLQFMLPYPMFQPVPCDDDPGPGGPAPTPRKARTAVDADGRPDTDQLRLWKEAA
jgi:hypothetical protein